MHDVFVALAFVAVVAGPAIVSARSGRDSEDEA
jgi:hypothetical protein